MLFGIRAAIIDAGQVLGWFIIPAAVVLYVMVMLVAGLARQASGRRRVLWTATCLWALAGSLATFVGPQRVGHYPRAVDWSLADLPAQVLGDGGPIARTQEWGNIASYLVLAALLATLLGGRASAVLCLALTVATETVQYVANNGRIASLADVVLNLVGCALGLAVWRAFEWLDVARGPGRARGPASLRHAPKRGNSAPGLRRP